MSERKLELKDICGYLPHGLCAKVNVCDEERIYRIVSMSQDHVTSVPTQKGKIGIAQFGLGEYVPILRPLSDLYETVMHNGKDVVPIVELARIVNTEKSWKFGMINAYEGAISEWRDVSCGNQWGVLMFFVGHGFCLVHCGAIISVDNQPALWDYLHALKIDYRDLIDAGLAVSARDVGGYVYG